MICSSQAQLVYMCVRKVLFLPAAISFALLIGSSAGGEVGNPDIAGDILVRILDRQTAAPVVGASVTVEELHRGRAADDNGECIIARAPAGSYTLIIRSVGYEPQTIADVTVTAGEETVVNVGLQHQAIKMDSVRVFGRYVPSSSVPAKKVIDFTAKDIRSSPGSIGDISRIVSIHPGVARTGDLFNSLIVRGGASIENGFYLDGVEIPNINHYPMRGTSGGGISLLNVDFIEDVNISAGGFPAAYGDRLSAIMDIAMRDGRRDRHAITLDLNAAGIGGAAEGPLGGSGSWLFAARRSFLDLLVDRISTGSAPRYRDAQGKSTIRLSPHNTVSILGVAGSDQIDLSGDVRFGSDEESHAWWDSYEYAAGVSWRYSPDPNDYSLTSLSVLGARYRWQYTDQFATDTMSNEDSYERAFQIRSVHAYDVSSSDRVQFGGDYCAIFNSYNLNMGRYLNPLGGVVPSTSVAKGVHTMKYGAHFSYSRTFWSSLTVTLGCRYDYFDYLTRDHLSPRVSLTYDISDRTQLYGAAGIYHQNIPLLLLAHENPAGGLEDLSADHYIAGINRQFSPTSNLSLEAYLKNYDHFPMDPNQPSLFLIDEIIYRGQFNLYENLVSEGRARSYGIETAFQKKARQGVFGAVYASYAQAVYRGLDGAWRHRVVENRIAGGLEGGYDPGGAWRISFRWVIASGRPYTPYDIVLSRRAGGLVFDTTRINEARLPDYHVLNVRLDRRFRMLGTQFNLYASVWNLYDRRNIYTYTWDKEAEQPVAIYQWGILPILGIEVKF